MNNPNENGPEMPALTDQFVRAPQLLEILFAPESRPSLRWLRQHQHKIPHLKLGAAVFFHPPTVKMYFNQKASARK